MKIKNLWLNTLIIMLFSLSAHGEAERREAFVRSGFVTGTFQGKDVDNGTFTTDVNLQAEFWLYRKPQESWIFQLLVANESELARSRYFGAGIGQRYFVRGDGFNTDSQMGGDFFKSSYNFSYYVGWDANIVQFLVVPFGDLLSTYATNIEAGGVAGVRKPYSKDVSFDLSGGAYFGYSVSSAVSVTTMVYRVLAGVGFSF